MNMRNYADQKHNVPHKGRGTLCFSTADVFVFTISYITFSTHVTYCCALYVCTLCHRFRQFITCSGNIVYMSISIPASHYARQHRKPLNAFLLTIITLCTADRRADFVMFYCFRHECVAMLSSKSDQNSLQSLLKNV
jgi:hypothetical protein